MNTDRANDTVARMTFVCLRALLLTAHHLHRLSKNNCHITDRYFNNRIQLMEKPTLPTRKGFLKKAALTCAGFFAATGVTTASGKKLSRKSLDQRVSNAPRIRAAAGTVAHGSVR